MTITRQQLDDAVFWEQTICVGCGATEGEPLFLCFECDSAVVLDAKLVKQIADNVEGEEEEGG